MKKWLYSGIAVAMVIGFILALIVGWQNGRLPELRFWLEATVLIVPISLIIGCLVGIIPLVREWNEEARVGLYRRRQRWHREQDES